MCIRDSALLRLAYDFYQSIGKEAVLLRRECPGFIANRLQLALYREVQDLVMRGVCSVEDADKALVYGPGLRWAIFGHNMIMQLGNPGGLTGMVNMLGNSGDRWLADMASWTHPVSYTHLHDQQITQQEGAAAVGAHLAGKFPDVAQAHRRAGCGQDEAQVGGPLVPLFRHKSIPPHSNRIRSTIPQNSSFFKGNVRPGRTHPFPAREYDGSSHVEGRRIPCGMN